MNLGTCLEQWCGCNKNSTWIRPEVKNGRIQSAFFIAVSTVSTRISIINPNIILIYRTTCNWFITLSNALLVPNAHPQMDWRCYANLVNPWGYVPQISVHIAKNGAMTEEDTDFAVKSYHCCDHIIYGEPALEPTEEWASR